jgi:preprotein translocase subunit SecE
VGRAGRGSSPWVIRTIVAVAVVIVVVAVIFAAVNGVLFSLPKKH